MTDLASRPQAASPADSAPQAPAFAEETVALVRRWLAEASGFPVVRKRWVLARGSPWVRPRRVSSA